MTKAPLAVAVAMALVALTPALPIHAADTSALPTPAPHTGTPPPTIYHIVTRPLCAELHKHVAPAVGMMLENDRIMKSSPKLFSDYNRENLYGVDNSASNTQGYNPNGGATTITDDPGSNATQQMTMLKMENMVSPIANNIIAMQRILDSPAMTQQSSNPEDDKRLAEIRAKLLKAIADQNATLDIINGFVQTQQMGDLQHAGQAYINATSQSEIQGKSGPGAGAEQTPNPLMADPNQAGLPPNPYDIQLAAIPGLTLGYNPVTRLLDAVNWTLEQTRTNENDASVAIMSAAQSCGAGPAASPAPHASP